MPLSTSILQSSTCMKLLRRKFEFLPFRGSFFAKKVEGTTFMLLQIFEVDWYFEIIVTIEQNLLASKDDLLFMTLY
jgi:hypothetical protein